MLRVLITIALLGVASAAVSTKIADWSKRFKKAGWSRCADDHFLTGMYRSDRKSKTEGLDRIKEAECKSVESTLAVDCPETDCYELKIRAFIFNKKKWAVCKAGYFMQSIYSANKEKYASRVGLHKIEKFKCCRPRSKNVAQANCYEHDVKSSFDKKGWSKCNSGFYMKGIYKSACTDLHCLDKFQCCEMVAASTTVTTKIADWWDTFDNGGESKCADGHFLTGLYRGEYKKGDERIGRIEEGECKSAPANLGSGQECYKLDIWSSFDKKGWAKCKAGYYIQSILSTKGKNLSNIEEFQCCRPKGGVTVDGRCYSQSVSKSFNDKGWSKCRGGYYMQGMYRMTCEFLHCIEKFRCCQMKQKC